MRTGLIVLAAAALVGIAGPAHAVVFDLASCAQVFLPADCNNTDTGYTALVYRVGDVTMEAFGPEDLDLVNRGPGETGLGLFPEVHNEIDSSHLVTLDFSDLAGRGATGGILTVESLQSGEVGIVTDVLGTHTISQVDDTLTGDVTIAFSKASPFVTLTAASGDVLAAAEVSVVPAVTPVPEPGPWLLFGTSVLGLGLLRLRTRS